MASEKNERLVNLVIALLATKKYLTKNQIFKAVAGYEGSAEASDRMFERDKEELRALGIQIEMRSIDPLFDDEIGYRIPPDRYKFDLGTLSIQEVTYLALAAQAWKESALKDVARATSVRLESLGISSDFSELPMSPYLANVPENLTQILEAIEQRRVIEFPYLGIEDKSEIRSVAPHGLYSKEQRWYLYALDTQIEDFRNFRLDRIEGEIRKTGKSFELKPFTLPDEHFEKIETLLEIRRDFAPELLRDAKLLQLDDEWIQAKVVFKSKAQACAEILKHSPNVKVLEPNEVVSLVKSSLTTLAGQYGD